MFLENIFFKVNENRFDREELENIKQDVRSYIDNSFKLNLTCAEELELKNIEKTIEKFQSKISNEPFEDYLNRLNIKELISADWGRYLILNQELIYDLYTNEE